MAWLLWSIRILLNKNKDNNKKRSSIITFKQQGMATLAKMTKYGMATLAIAAFMITTLILELYIIDNICINNLLFFF